MSFFQWTGQAVARVGVVALLLAVSGCYQRKAPVYVPQGNPPPRAVQTQPWPGVPPYQQPLVTAPEQPRPSEGQPAPYERPDLGINADRPPQPRIAQVPRLKPPRADRAPEAPASSDQPPGADERPKVSDDYATLLGEDGKPPAGVGSATREEARDGGLEGRRYGDYPGLAAAKGPAVLVAILVPESDKRGSIRQLADGLAKAASLAAADFDEPRLELRKYDTGGEPAKAAEAARRAVADGAKLIIGPLFSGSASAVRPVAQQAGIAAIAFTTDESVLGGGLYSIGFLPKTDINRIISYAARRDMKDIAALAPDTPYGAVVYSESRAAASRSGANIVRVQPFQPDFRAMESTAKEFAKFYENAPNVDAILLAANGQELQGLASYLAYNKVLPSQVKFLGLGLWDEKETFREGTLKGGWFPGVDPASKGDFNGRYEAAYGSNPPSIAFLSYDAVAVAATLLRMGGGKDPFTRQALQNPSGFTGMSGLFRFRSDGRNDRALSILEVGRGEFRVVDPAAQDFSGLAGG